SPSAGASAATYTSDRTPASLGPAITAPPYACAARRVGPLVLSSKRSRADMSSLSAVSGIGAQATLRPSLCNGRNTFCQHELSGHAPWTSTIVEFGAQRLTVMSYSLRGTLS